ncbi:hypothetical protein IT575_09135 [bacterium]|nr:hypothetical protein [bacterium]
MSTEANGAEPRSSTEHGNGAGKPVRIACLSLLAAPEQRSGSAELPGGRVEWDIYPSPANLEYVSRQLPELLERYDAVALQGIVSSFRIAGRRYQYDPVWQLLDLDRHYARVSDGSGLRNVLERFLIAEALKEVGPQVRGKRILVLCGLSRYGAAEVLSGVSDKLTFGDLLYGYRLGIPIQGFKSFVNAAPQLVQMVSATPAQWFWPSTRSGRPWTPRYRSYFRRSDVIVGDLPYFERYAPSRLSGKTLFVTLNSESELDFFRRRGARCVVSLTPVIDGQYMPLAVLGAALKLQARGRSFEELEAFYLARLQQMVREHKLAPSVFDFHPEATPELGLADLPRGVEKKMAPVEKQPVELSASEEIGKFAFVIHPLHFGMLKRLPPVKLASRFLPQRLLEDAIARVKPFAVGSIKDVTSASGAKAEGILYAVPMTSKAILRHPPEFLYQRLVAIAQMAQQRGAGVMGLGAYTSVVGDAGLTVSKRSPIGITSGNSFTVAATMETLRQAAERCGIEPARSFGLVVGATGSIGSVCARLLAREVQEIALVAPRPEKLLDLSRLIEEETPRLAGRVHISRRVEDFLSRAELVITTTSAVDPVIDVSALKSGAVVCDVARPPDIKEEAAARRSDILVIESGEIMLPPGSKLNYDIGLPPGTIYACLAETLLLALEKRYGHYTLGREIDPDKVEEIAAIGRKHGLKLAPIRSFGREVPAERFEALRGINQPAASSADASAFALESASAAG